MTQVEALAKYAARAAFFDHVADNVDWIGEGTHPLAGHYLTKKAFIEGTFAKLGQVLPQGAQLHTEHQIVKDDQAVVELHSLATAKNGMRFDNRYCWVVYFQDGLIVRVRAYLTRQWSPDCSRRIRLQDRLERFSLG
jgi:ketosteroid isomerase-like protein